MGKRPIDSVSPGHERRRAASPSDHRPALLARLRRWLRISLRRLQRKLKRALATPQASKILTALLARRLPRPLRVLVEGLGDPEQRGFLFWWLIVTVIVTLAIALLLSIALAPVTGIVALVGVGVWMLIHKDRQPAGQPS
jgi:small-conductance mechanosensitive channel